MPRPTLSDERLAMAWHSAALLLGRPGQALLDQLDSVHRASHRLPDEVGGPLRATIVHLEQAPLRELQSEHSRTFDGPSLPYGEPAAALCDLLEKAAQDASSGYALLLDRRAQLERLRDTLVAQESGWAGAVIAVTASLQRSDGFADGAAGSRWSGA